MIPDGWQQKTLGEVITLQRGFDLPEQDRIHGAIPIISSSGISGFHNESKVSPPGIVTGRYGTIGKVFFVDVDFWPLNTSLWVKDFYGNDRRYIYYLLNIIDYGKLSDKTGVPGINRNDVHKLKVLVPPLSEQCKIAEILGVWDEAIDLLEKLVVKTRSRKQGLMQQLLTGKKRFKEFEGSEWEKVSLEKIADINPRNHPKNLQYLGEFVEMASVSESGHLKNIACVDLATSTSGYTEFINGDTLVAKITPCFENGKGALIKGKDSGGKS